MPHTRSAVLLAFALLLPFGLSSSAMADEDEGSVFSGYTPAAQRETRTSLLPFRLDLHGVMTWEADLGAGLRADISIFDKARLYSAHDELAISVGADVSFVTFGGSNRITTWPTVAAQWSLAVSEHFSLYPELGIVARIERSEWKGLYPNVGFGGRFTLYRSLAIMGRLGWPMAVSLGITF